METDWGFGYKQGGLGNAYLIPWKNYLNLGPLTRPVSVGINAKGKYVTNVLIPKLLPSPFKHSSKGKNVYYSYVLEIKNFNFFVYDGGTPQSHT